MADQQTWNQIYVCVIGDGRSSPYHRSAILSQSLISILIGVDSNNVHFKRIYFLQSFSVPLDERIQVRAGDFLGIHYPRDNRSAVPYRFGGWQSGRHHKFTAFNEDLFVNYTVTPNYNSSSKRPALKAYVKGENCFLMAYWYPYFLISCKFLGLCSLSTCIGWSPQVHIWVRHLPTCWESSWWNGQKRNFIFLASV